jgi:2-polyprenyl-6-methoxyphenol hydroxylase-like FAD-dependent oxidoreductase
VVVGAGVAGLAVAGGLARGGWSVTLLERAERVRPGAGGHLLWPNGLRALQALGVQPAVVAAPPGGVRRPDGRWLVPPGRLPGPGPAALSGEELHDALVAALGDRVDLRAGTEVSGVRPAGDRPAVLVPGGAWEADLVVAADGAGSAVRPHVAPQSRPAPGGFAMWRAALPWFRAPQLPADGASGEVLGAGHRFRWTSAGPGGSPLEPHRGGLYWTATVPGAARPEPPQAQLALVRRWFAGWPSPVAELLAATEPADLVQDPVRELRPLPDAFHRDPGYVLVGDAAHAMADHLAQGPSLALEDAATLAILAAPAAPGPELAAALARYSRLRRPRAAAVARRAHRLGALVGARSGIAARVGGSALGALAHRLLDGGTILDWRPPTPAAPSG